jgi:uncharacterized radical SAM protein YgiQ
VKPDNAAIALRHSDEARKLFSYPKYWAECFGTAPYLPMSRAEMDSLGWDSCDIIIVTADAYIDHPSFGMAVVGRLLEALGFRVGIISQPAWDSAEAFQQLGKPNLFFGVTGGNMDSLINRYTADLRLRSDDAYTPNGEAGKRPDRSVIVYSQRCREAYYDAPIVIGGIEASLRRIAQYDYWSDKVRRSILVDSNADILLFGNAERALAELATELAAGKRVEDCWDLRGTAMLRDAPPCRLDRDRLNPNRLASKNRQAAQSLRIQPQGTRQRRPCKTQNRRHRSGAGAGPTGADHSTTLAAPDRVRQGDQLYSLAVIQ